MPLLSNAVRTADVTPEPVFGCALNVQKSSVAVVAVVSFFACVEVDANAVNSASLSGPDCLASSSFFIQFFLHVVISKVGVYLTSAGHCASCHKSFVFTVVVIVIVVLCCCQLPAFQFLCIRFSFVFNESIFRCL